MYKFTENSLLCFASLASSDFPLMPCNIKQRCHSSGQRWMLQYMDENQCWSRPLPNPKAVTTRTGTASNLQDLFGFGSPCQILARYHSRGMKTKSFDQKIFIKIKEKEVNTDIFYVTLALFYTASTQTQSLLGLLSTHFLYLQAFVLFFCLIINQHTVDFIKIHFLFNAETKQELPPISITCNHTLTPRCLETNKSLRLLKHQSRLCPTRASRKDKILVALYGLSLSITTKAGTRKAQQRLLVGENLCAEPFYGALIFRKPVSAEFSSSPESPPVLVQEAAVIWGVIIAARFRGEYSAQRVMRQSWPRVFHTPMDKTFHSAYLAWGHLRWSAK